MIAQDLNFSGGQVDSMHGVEIFAHHTQRLECFDDGHSVTFFDRFHLEARFGDAWRDYKARTRRWI
mgnify:CR=1 FL=1